MNYFNRNIPFSFSANFANFGIKIKTLSLPALPGYKWLDWGCLYV
jgi:hypothetical protein